MSLPIRIPIELPFQGDAKQQACVADPANPTPEELKRLTALANCVDCDRETMPGEYERTASGLYFVVEPHTWEMYLLKDHIWRKTGLGFGGGSLCVGCAERRLGRRLRRRDFDHSHGGYHLPDLSTARLLKRVGCESAVVWYRNAA